MSLHEVLEHLIHEGVALDLTDEGRLHLRAVAEDRPIRAEVLDSCSKNRDALIAWLRHKRGADVLLLESSRRIGTAWPFGFPLEGPEWDAHEQHLHEAYWSGDLEQLKSALEAREQYALRVFGAHRNEVRNV